MKAGCVLLTSAHQLSKAKVARLLANLLAIPMSAGPVCAIEAEDGRQLEPVVDELRMAVRQQSDNVNETSSYWSYRGSCWDGGNTCLTGR